MDSKMSLNPIEFMACRAAQELTSNDVAFIGIGLPILASGLARATHAPNLHVIVEAGVIDGIPTRLPISVGDPSMVAGSLSVVGCGDIFQSFLQNGLIDIGLLGAAQIDKYGNINSTVLGDYHNPKDRLPGSGGACDIAAQSKRVVIIVPMSPRTFVEQCDFVTSAGHRFNSKMPSGQKSRALASSNKGVHRVVTNLGVCEFIDGELMLTEMYPGVSPEEIKSNCGWSIKISKNFKTSDLPSQDIIDVLRNKIDPEKLYL